MGDHWGIVCAASSHFLKKKLVNSISGYYNTYSRLLTFCPVLGSLRIWRASFISPPNARAQQPQRPLPYLASLPTSATAAAATALCRSKHSPLPQHTLPQSLPPPPQQASKRREHKHDPHVSLVLCAGKKATAVGLRKILNLFWPIRFRTITIHTSTSTSYFLPRVGQPSNLEGLLHKPSKCPRPTTAAPLAQRRPQWLRLRSV